MNKRLLTKLMRERVDGLLNSGVYFWKGTFEHVAEGVALEYVPRGLYVWNFKFPLFDAFGPNLSFSHRLPEHSFFETGTTSETAIIDYVMAAPDIRRTFDAESPMTLDQFIGYLNSQDRLSPHMRLVHAAAYALDGRDSLAIEILDDVKPLVHRNSMEHFNQLVGSIREGHAAVTSLLMSVQDQNIQRLSTG